MDRWTLQPRRVLGTVISQSFAPGPLGLVVSLGEFQMSGPETRWGWGREWLCPGRLSHMLACPLQFMCVPRLCLFLPG